MIHDMKRPWKRFTFSKHALQTIKDKGFSMVDVLKTLKEPDEVYPSGKYPGQWRMTGNGLCIVGRPEDDLFTVITVYLDRVFTPLRPDQIAAGVQIQRTK